MMRQFDNELFYSFKDAFMIEFLKDDLDTIYKMEEENCNPDDLKENKKLKNAYKAILKYYGVKE